MSYTLYGSKTSPFVRRIRLLMELIPYHFEELNIYEKEDAHRLNKINPINQIPVLTDGEITIWDSRQIFNYLNHTHKMFHMGWEQENLLTAMEGAMTSGISLLLMKRSGINIDESSMFVDRQKERIESVLNFLSPYIKNEALKEWNFLTMTLYSFLDWAIFREIISLKDRPECQQFLETYKDKAVIKQTLIPRT